MLKRETKVKRERERKYTKPLIEGNITQTKQKTSLQDQTTESHLFLAGIPLTLFLFSFPLLPLLLLFFSSSFLPSPCTPLPPFDLLKPLAIPLSFHSRNYDKAQVLFVKCLNVCPHVDLWCCYLDFLLETKKDQRTVVVSLID
jgi:hypothetical protein